MIIYKEKQKGFTLIETMIAIAVFLIVIMIGMGALLNANVLHRKSQDMRTIMDNLSFIMEDMSRSLRTGYDYHCVDDNNFSATNPHSCLNDINGLPTGFGISFKSTVNTTVESGPNQWVYKLEVNAKGDGYNIRKSLDGGSNFGLPLNTDDITIKSGSGFTVIGAEPPGDIDQPYVIVRLLGNIKYKDIDTPFALQTSVSQRLPDR